jgi:hypothetical protein
LPDGALEILELQPAGNRSMPAAEFSRGHRVHPGDSFGPASMPFPRSAPD